jgi:hypothetical protein
MDKKKKQELLEAAKSVLKVKEFRDYQERRLVLIHDDYETWAETKAEMDYSDKVVDVLIDFKKAASRLSRFDEYVWPYGRMFDRESVEKAVGAIHPAVAEVEKIQTIRRKKGIVATPKRGRPPSARLHEYVGRMAEWYYFFFGKLAYGTNSRLTKLINNCLGIIDTKYIDNPPHKAIKDAVLRKRPLLHLFPHERNSKKVP